MASVAICDCCGTRIGSRSTDHTIYGKTKETMGTRGSLRMSPRAFPKLDVVLLADSVGDFCAACVREAAMHAMGVDPEEIARVQANYTSPGEALSKVQNRGTTVRERGI